MFSNDNIKQAITEFLDRGMSSLEIAKFFEIDKKQVYTYIQKIDRETKGSGAD